MKRFLIILIATLICGSSLSAAKRRSLRTKLGKSKTETVAEQKVDTVAPAPDAFILSGYDKALRANKETVFVTNYSDSDIIGFELLTKYFDMQGRQIHELSRLVHADIPAGATRKVDYPSWDRQQSFYYHESRHPKISATPYDVQQAIVRVLILQD